MTNVPIHRIERRMILPTLNGPQWENVEIITDKPDYRSVGGVHTVGDDKYVYMARLTRGGVNMDVTHKGTIVGSMHANSWESDPSKIEIQGIDVSPSYRRRGIATNMLNFARAHAFEGTSIEHSDQLTPSGKQFVQGLRNKGIN